MPVGLRLSFPSNTLEDYDKVTEALNFPADWPDGLIVHGSHEAAAPERNERRARRPRQPARDRGARALPLLRARDRARLSLPLAGLQPA